MKRELKEKIIFSFVFIILGYFALQIPFTTVLGANVKFTLFDFLAPTAGAFLGSWPGVISVLLIQLLNILIHGATRTNLAGMIRIFPILFAVIYFSKKRPTNFIIPLISIILFNLHPIGRSAWLYSMFWFIPVFSHFFRKNLYIKSLGATFCAHGVGGVLWVWTFGLSKEMWLSLIPQTFVERILMAGGISLSYLLIISLVKALAKLKILSDSYLVSQIN